MIVFTHTPAGGFVAGNTDTRITAYAYPKGTHALDAVTKPDDVAANMLRQEGIARAMGWGEATLIAAADAHHWNLLKDVAEGEQVYAPPGHGRSAGKGFAA